MKVLSFGVVSIVTFGLINAAFADTRRFACIFTYTTDNHAAFQSFQPGKSIGIDEKAISDQLKTSVAQGKPAVVPIDLKDENSYVSVEFQALVGMQCAVAGAPGCPSMNSGPMVHATTITLTDKATGQKISMGTLDGDSAPLPSLTIENRFPSLWFSPLHQIHDPDGNLIKNLGVVCEDVYY